MLHPTNDLKILSGNIKFITLHIGMRIFFITKVYEDIWICVETSILRFLVYLIKKIAVVSLTIESIYMKNSNFCYSQPI